MARDRRKLEYWVLCVSMGRSIWVLYPVTSGWVVWGAEFSSSGLAHIGVGLRDFRDSV